MRVWFLDELLRCREELYSSIVTDRRVTKFFALWAGIARHTIFKTEPHEYPHNSFEDIVSVLR